jgi:hypothetical protein
VAVSRRNIRSAALAAAVVLLGGVGLVAAAGPSLAHPRPQPLARVNVSDSGVEDDGGAVPGVGIAGDGRYVVFSSTGRNLVASGPRSPIPRVYLRDQRAGTTELVSVERSGAVPTLGRSDLPTVSDDGNLVAFQSTSVLTPDDTNGSATDVYLRDRSAGVTTLVSVGRSGFAGNGVSVDPMVSADGRYVVFASRANDLVAGDNNRLADVFVRDIQAGTVWRVSTTPTGGEGNGDSSEPAISPDGLFVAFSSTATNLVPVDANGFRDVFLAELATDGVELASATGSSLRPNQLNGNSGQPSVSSHGRFVAFDTEADNYDPNVIDDNSALDVVRLNRGSGELRAVSVLPGWQYRVGNGASYSPVVGADGTVAFLSAASDLWRWDDNGLVDVYRYLDRVARQVSMQQNHRRSAGQSDGPSGAPAIDSSGLYIAFSTDATNLVKGDTNCVTDVLVTVPLGTEYRGEPGPPCGPEPVPTTSPLPTVPPVPA